jgi:sialic acid synthase SpsE
MRIGTREIGSGHPVYIIAELGVNHDGSVERALEMVDAAADAGADAIKMQYFEADRLMSRAAKLAAYQRAAGELDPIAMLRRLELSFTDMVRVIARAHSRNIHAIVTVFSLEHVDAVSRLSWDAFKSASPDIINWPLLRAMMATGRPLIVSTGAAESWEVQDSYHDLLEPLGDRLAMLQCVSCYPTRREDASIAGVQSLDPDITLRGGAIGYSDHTSELDTGLLAVRIGASILEKHLTHDRSAAGPDHSASLDATGLAEYIRLARSVPPDEIREWVQPTAEVLASDVAYGPWEKRVLDCEFDVRVASRQSIVSTRVLKRGESISRADVTLKRPGTGIRPAQLDELIGCKVLRTVDADMPLSPRDVHGDFW